MAKHAFLTPTLKPVLHNPSMADVVKFAVYLTAVITLACCSLATAQFTLEDAEKVMSSLLEKYPGNLVGDDLYWEFSKHEAHLHLTDRSALVEMPLWGRVETVTGGTPAVAYVNHIEGMLSRSVLEGAPNPFPPVKACGRFEVLVWEAVPWGQLVSIAAAKERFKDGLEARGYSYSPHHTYNDVMNNTAAPRSGLRSELVWSLRGGTDFSAYKNDLHTKLIASRLNPEYTARFRAANSSAEVARLLVNPATLDIPVYHAFAARKGQRLLAGLWSGLLPGELGVTPARGVSLVLCDLNRTRPF